MPGKNHALLAQCKSSSSYHISHVRLSKKQFSVKSHFAKRSSKEGIRVIYRNGKGHFLQAVGKGSIY